MFSYTAYELGIYSEIPLPGLIAARNPSQDVFVRLRTRGTVGNEEAGSSLFFRGETPGVAVFLVRDGKEIIVNPAPAVEGWILTTILLGPILSILLRQRGLAVIHASAVVINDGAVAFLGQSGWGKSTLAEACYHRGYGVITDDVMAVSFNRGPHVLPGYPSIKLFPDVAGFFGCKASNIRSIHSQTDKKAHCVAAKFPDKPLSLRRMYVLAGGGCNEIESLTPQEVFVELVRNARAVNLLRDAESLSANMRQCTRLAAEVPTFRLKRQPCLAILPAVVKLIEEHLA